MLVLEYMCTVLEKIQISTTMYIKTEIKDLKVSNVIESAFHWIALLQLKYAKLAMRAD